MSLEEQIAKLGTGPLTEEGLKKHVWPLFSRVMAGDRERSEIYLANHSLGRPLDQVEDDVLEGLQLWYSRMDESWEAGGWMDEVDRFRANVARLIGLSDSSAVVPKTSAGQGLRAVLNALPKDGSVRPVRVVATRGEFDSIDFILKTYGLKGRAEVTWVEPSQTEQGVPMFSSGEIVEAIPPGVDLVVVSQVVFATGQVMPNLDLIVAAAHEAGAMALIDSYHAVGVVPVQFESLGADFMIGGSYKYTRGGPGACWLAIHPRHLNSPLRTLDTGWFAKKEPFGYERTEDPELAESGVAWLESTPPVLTAYQASSGLRLTLALGVERLRAYSLQQQSSLRSAFQDHGVPCFMPPDPSSFGAFSLVPSNDPPALVKALKAAGVNIDARGGCVRFGPDILNSTDELRSAAEVLARTGQC